ncbi:MAG: hypothetical protein HY319_10205 [Armatimonadetes bacterium]|nr:hypothetical protein [Armatimonadota bacterium]
MAIEQVRCYECGRLVAKNGRRCECGAGLGGAPGYVTWLVFGILPFLIGVYLFQYGNWRPYDPPYWIGAGLMGVGVTVIVTRGTALQVSI